MDTRVTVIIVNWNGGKFLQKCLAALMNQTVKPHEIILVDNASSDHSIEIAQRFPSVRLIALDFNSGFAKGNNIAISAASEQSEWIALLNPDAFPEPRWLEELLIAAQSIPGFDTFGSKLLSAESPHLLDGTGDAFHISGKVWRMNRGALLSTLSENAREIFSPCAAAALYRRQALTEAGGFDEDYFCYVEDVDLGFRLRLKGYRCLYVPKSVVHHIGSGTTGGQHSDFSVYHGHRNLVWTFVKNMPGIVFWLLLPLHLLLNLLTILRFTMRGRCSVVLKSKRDALLGLPKMWRKRQKIQQGRTARIRDIWHVLDKQIVMKIF